ncbi:MAG: 2'-5' ligase [Acidobacteria bacterium]|nr:2'-5' ligase [Acidobacteriota bacterium]
MRTFVAIDLPSEIRRKVMQLIALLQPTTTHVRWARADGLHLTLKFIGEITPEKVAEVSNRLSSIRIAAPISLAIRGAGYFPHERSPRVIWLGVEAGADFPALAAQVEEALLPLGIAKENRPFAAHLTLGRLKSPDKIPLLQEVLRRQEPLDFGAFEAEEFFLYESQLAPGGSLYRRIARFAFAV